MLDAYGPELVAGLLLVALAQLGVMAKMMRDIAGMRPKVDSMWRWFTARAETPARRTDGGRDADCPREDER